MNSGVTDHSGVTEHHKSGSILRLLESTDWPELQATPHRCFFGPPIRKGTSHFLAAHPSYLFVLFYIYDQTHTHLWGVTSDPSDISAYHTDRKCSPLNCLPSLLPKCSCNLSQGSLAGRILFLRLNCTRTVRMPGNKLDRKFHVVFYSLWNSVLRLFWGINCIAFNSLPRGGHFKGLCGPKVQYGVAFLEWGICKESHGGTLADDFCLTCSATCPF